jgi:hypothetical protein
MLRNASSDRSARFSWTKPMMALNSTTVSTTSGVFSSPETTKATTAAAMRMRMRRSVNCASSRRHAGTLGAAANSFGPCSARRAAASALLRPTVGSTASVDARCDASKR